MLSFLKTESKVTKLLLLLSVILSSLYSYPTEGGWRSWLKTVKGPSPQPSDTPTSVHSSPDPDSDQKHQERIMPGQTTKEQRVFVSPDYVIYWPVSKPFWIRLATSPEDAAQSFLLSQFSEKVDLNSKDLFKKGIKLEIPGKQFVRWYNFLSKNEISYRFEADGGPPVTRIQFNGAPQLITPAGLMFGRNLNVALAADDDDSGVRYIGYSINKAPYSWYDKSLNIFDEGGYSIQYYAVDNVGYTSKFETTEFRVILTPPTTELVFESGSDGKVIGPSALLTLRTQPETRTPLAPVKVTSFKFDADKEFHPYSKPITLGSLSDGDHVLYYFSEDQLNNRENPKETTFYLDRTPPDVGHAFIGDYSVKGEISYISPETKIRLDARVIHSKVKEILFKIGDSPYKQYNDAFQLEALPKNQSVSYQARDGFDNLSQPKTFLAFVDNIAPKTHHQFTGPMSTQAASTYFISDSTKISLTATDEESGIRNIYYQLGDQPAVTYNGSFSLENEGRKLLRYWSVDKVNNHETEHAILVVVDKTPPDILVVFSSDPIQNEVTHRNPAQELAKGQSQKQSSKDQLKDPVKELPKVAPEMVYPVGSTALINATDSLSGVEDIMISLNGEPSKKYQGPIKFEKPMKYKLTVIARDRVGNQSKKDVEFRIEGK